VSHQNKSHVIAFRVSPAEFDDWQKRAAGNLSDWIRKRIKAEPEGGVRYVSTNNRAGISITITNDNRWQTWINAGWYVSTRDKPWCCPSGHERLEDAIDHGVSILRALLLAERETWPAESIGAQLLAGVPKREEG
jgi:hypothetical protein